MFTTGADHGSRQKHALRQTLERFSVLSNVKGMRDVARDSTCSGSHTYSQR